MEGLREGYEYFVDNCGGYIGVEESAAWIDAIDVAIEQLQRNLDSYAGDGRGLDQLGGYIAEEWHKGTFNIDAAIRESADRASILPANKLGSVDIHLKSGPDYSLKYYKSADRSLVEQAMTYGEKSHTAPEAARAIEEGATKASDLLYDGQGRLVPSDQLESARAAASRKVAKESVTRPEQAERYRRTGGELTDRVCNGEGVESRPFTKQQSRDLALDAKKGEVDLEKYGITEQQLVRFEDVLRKSIKAGMTAAAVAAVLSAAPTVIEALDHLVETGVLDPERFRTAGAEALSGGARGFLTGASTAAIVASAGAGFFGETFKNLDPSAVGAMAVVLVNVIGNSAKVAAGKMEAAEMVDALARDSFVATAAVLLGGAVQAAMPEFPVFGYLLGSFVGSAASGLAYGAGKNVAVALCVERGFTLFGLVDQDYRLPESAVREIGADVFEYETFDFDKFEPDEFAPEAFAPDAFEADKIGISFLSRGVVGVARVGYA